jgi:chromosome segregation ATPase
VAIPASSTSNATPYSSSQAASAAAASVGADVTAVLAGLRSRNDTLEKENENLRARVSSSQKAANFESTRATETASELARAREVIREQEHLLSDLNKEKKTMHLKVEEMSSQLSKRPHASETQRTFLEMDTKVRFLERKCADLEKENERLQSSVQTLEGELEEVQDNFREDEAGEYRNLKRELETASKSCRVLQFKLKKTEKSMIDLAEEKAELQKQLSMLNGGSSSLDHVQRIRSLESELDAKSSLVARLEKQLTESAQQNNRKTLGPCLSKTGSIDRSVEDQLLKDLQDSIERENDLKEQLNMAEEESTETRMKISRLEDENESLVQQLKKMSAARKSRRSPSPAHGNGNADGAQDVLPNGELQLQLELSEQEVSVLRKKVEALIGEKLKLSKDVKEVTQRLNEALKPKKGPVIRSEISDQQKLNDLQDELNTVRVKVSSLFLIRRSVNFSMLLQYL